MRIFIRSSYHFFNIIQNCMYLQQSWKYQWSLKVCDSIIAGSSVSGIAFCYVFQPFKCLNC